MREAPHLRHRAVVVLLALVASASFGASALPLPFPVEDAGAQFVPAPPGTTRELAFTFGPFTVPPGQDLTRIATELPVRGGFVTRIIARAIDVETLEEPSNMIFHIHHFLWLRPSLDGETDLAPFHDYLFASGEERTRLDLDRAAAADPSGPRFGLYVEDGVPHTLVYMLHNKLTRAATALIRIEVTFVDGSAEEIASARSCAGVLAPPGGDCAAGQEFRALENRLWGSIFDVPRRADGPGFAVVPENGQRITMSRAGTMVTMTGHVHPGAREIVVANLGPSGSACEADLDGDTFAGVTIFRSRKVDRDARTTPWSEDFQMETTQPSWRAPVRAGDRLVQFAVYLDRDHATYNAMSILAQHLDAEASPPPRGSEGCTVANTRATIAGPGDATRGMLSREWEGDALPLCGDAFGLACDAHASQSSGGLDARLVQLAGFTYTPGDRNLAGALGAPAKVKRGESLLFVNGDAGAVVRHTITSCPWPCDGAYRANYPLPDGRFDSGRLGNLDALDQGGPWTEEARPVWGTPADLAPGLYAYYCRLHPTMRGAFEVQD